MQILVNEQPRDVPSGYRLLDLLGELGLASGRGIAVALHDRVIPRFEWSECVLQPNVSVLIVSATQGG
ncbi:MAG: sulfur carrier protein ThiS [Acidobacteria bacterium]|nr:sulfur carrier protein ThiS [Acidobacteriota bacterium]